MATGSDLIDIAGKHLKEPYVFGAVVPKDNAAWKGPWDCAEFTSWCLFQVTRKLFGCDQSTDPSTANAFTGFWADEARRTGCTAPVIVARNTPGAFLLRFATATLPGHVVICDGKGGTLEAHSHVDGVIRGVVDGRRWDMGILPPSIKYQEPDMLQPPVPAGLVLRIKKPPMRGKLIERLQARLNGLGFIAGDVDGEYGPHTAAAVQAFQLSKGLVPDGEAGKQTLTALGLM